jgi:DNA-binding IclR family transcriptional regulator
VKKRVNTKPRLDEAPLRRLEAITARLTKVRAQEQAIRDEQIDAIFECRNAGFSLRKIADSAGVSNPRIHATLKDFAEE